MPELPEVETTRRGLAPRIVGRRVDHAVVRNRAMRWPVPRALPGALAGQRLTAIHRRAKYLLFEFGNGTMLLHLGMSGRMRIAAAGTPPEKHDHFDLVFDDRTLVRLTDPRRFGSIHWITGDPSRHPLLKDLGPEPLEPAFDADHLHAATRGRSAAIKQVLMDSHVVVGVGNIYASESLHRARIHPATPAGRVSRPRLAALVTAVRATLSAAIEAGGSSMRDYVGADGAAGYFQFDWLVYGRAGEPCRTCRTPVKLIRQGQRATFFCPACQPRR
jgi:formamidopyrimidine-DNA glycosylase